MRKLILATASALLAAGVTLAGTTAASADPPVGNSGHSSNGSTQCKADSVNHCPPFGP
jgi:Spy/CpxP family protein refolding chaperone